MKTLKFLSGSFSGNERIIMVITRLENEICRGLRNFAREFELIRLKQLFYEGTLVIICIKISKLSNI